MATLPIRHKTRMSSPIIAREPGRAQHAGQGCVPLKWWNMEALIMAMMTSDVGTWAEQQFGACELGDRRRTRRLVKFAAQAAEKPDASTPRQTEVWADLKAAYRLFDRAEATFEAITAPHQALTRAVLRRRVVDSQ